MEQIWFTAASWLGAALLASLISIRTGISVALVETFLGVLAGNFLGFHSAPWIDVLAACCVTDLATVLALGVLFAILTVGGSFLSWLPALPCGCCRASVIGCSLNGTAGAASRSLGAWRRDFLQPYRALDP